MKKQLLAIATFLLPIACFSQVENGGFENWTNQTLYEDLEEWRTSNREFFDEGGMPTTLKSTDSQKGMYSVQLQTIELEDDTAFGFVLLGDVGDEGPSDGIPFTTDVDTLRGWWKYDFPPGDSGLVLLFMNNDTGTVLEQFWSITGSQSDWTAFALGFETNDTPTEMILGFASSFAVEDDHVALPGSMLMLDSLYFTNSGGGTPDPIPNEDFEDWEDVDVNEPNAWQTLNTLAVAFDDTCASQSSDAFAGTSALKLETITLDFGDGEVDTLSGLITNGEIGFFDGDVSGGIPYQAEPDTFKGAYKYSPAIGNDTAFVNVTFYENGEEILSEWVQIFGNIDTYTEFKVVLSLPSTPDTMRIAAWSGRAAGSTLWLDGLDLTGGDVGLTEQNKGFEFNIYPNPAREMLNVRYQLNTSNRVRLHVFDQLGKKVHAEELGNVSANTPQIFNLDLTGYTSGLYLFQLQVGTESYSQRLMVR